MTSGRGAASAERDPVSIVVCNYQGEAYLERVLGALEAQACEADELLLVDNASTDGGLALVAERFPRWRVLARPTNDGPCVARNEGLAAARHRLCLAVDNDAVLPAGALERLLAAFHGRPGVAAVQCRSVLAQDPPRVHYDGGSFHYVGLLSLRNFFVPLDAAEGRGVLAVDALVALAVLLDREVVLSLGGYDANYFYLMEDFDLAYRLRAAGHAILIEEDVVVEHLGGTQGLSFRSGDYPERRAFYHSRNRRYLLAKNYGWRALLLGVPALALYELVWCAFTIRQGQLLAYLRGQLAFLGLLPRALAARRAVQRRRVVRDRDLLCGGPLTFHPNLLAKPGPARVARALDRLLRLWWRLVGRWT